MTNKRTGKGKACQGERIHSHPSQSARWMGHPCVWVGFRKGQTTARTKTTADPCG
jgi:hypothetical protein